MLFQTKKKRIRAYLQKLSQDEMTAFDCLLCDYLSGALAKEIAAMGICRAEICIDWYEDVKCIGVQGKYQRYYVDLQIYPEMFMLSADPDEPECERDIPLNSKEQLYSCVAEALLALK